MSWEEYVSLKQLKKRFSPHPRHTLLCVILQMGDMTTFAMQQRLHKARIHFKQACFLTLANFQKGITSQLDNQVWRRLSFESFAIPFGAGLSFTHLHSAKHSSFSSPVQFFLDSLPLMHAKFSLSFGLFSVYAAETHLTVKSTALCYQSESPTEQVLLITCCVFAHTQVYLFCMHAQQKWLKWCWNRLGWWSYIIKNTCWPTTPWG